MGQEVTCYISKDDHRNNLDTAVSAAAECWIPSFQEVLQPETREIVRLGGLSNSAWL
jgi:hypothetical protein